MAFEGVYGPFPLPESFADIPSEIRLTYRIDVTRIFKFPVLRNEEQPWLAVATVTSPNAERSHAFFSSYDDLSALTIREPEDTLLLEVDPHVWPKKLHLQQRAADRRRTELGIELRSKYDLAMPDGLSKGVFELFSRGANGEWIGTELEDGTDNTMLPIEFIADVLDVQMDQLRSCIAQMEKAGLIKVWGYTYVPTEWEPTVRQQHARKLLDYMLMDANMHGPAAIDPLDPGFEH